ncbi:hypothetical protein DFQ13_1231, partial [Actinokineospora spheciospongiae]
HTYCTCDNSRDVGKLEWEGQRHQGE